MCPEWTERRLTRRTGRFPQLAHPSCGMTVGSIRRVRSRPQCRSRSRRWRISRKNSRMSVTSRSGRSSAAKWPPRGISVQRTRWKRAATHSRGRHDDLLREGRVRGRARGRDLAAQPRCTPTKSPSGSTQYSVMLVSDPRGRLSANATSSNMASQRVLSRWVARRCHAQMFEVVQQRPWLAACRTCRWIRSSRSTNAELT